MGAGNSLAVSGNESRFCAVVAESAFSTLFTEIAYRHFKCRYGPDLDTANPIDIASRSHTPILLIHGQADRNVLPFNSGEILAASHRNAAVAREGAGHCGA